jgi:CheY-like chemotaxis protein
LKILLVDDERDTLELLSTLLRQHGAEIRSAESATAALETINDWTPDAMISDIGMPDVDGYMLLARVRSEDKEHDKPIPAVAVTAYASEDDRVKAMSAGFQMYLTKPIQPEQLASAIARLAQTATLSN